MIPVSLQEQISQLVPALEGWCSVTKALEMANSLHRHRPSVCVEVGVFGGRSLLPLALVCRHLDHGHVYGIDPWSRSQALEGLTDPEAIEFWSRIDLEAIYRGCLQAIMDHSLTEHCTLIRQRSHDCRHLFAGIDFIHIDGNHDRDSAIRDVQLFLPRVVPGGQIWFDDADWESTQDAVQLLRNECRIVHNYGNVIHFEKRAATGTVTSVSQTPRSTVEYRHLPGGRTLLIHADDRRLGGHRGGIYNPGAIRHDGRILLLARNERFTELQRRADQSLWPNSCRPMAICLTEDLQIDSMCPLELPAEVTADRAEDFRLFRFRNQLFASYSRVLTAERIEIQVSAVDWAQRRLLNTKQPKLDFATSPVEKNWCFFELDGSLYLLYSFQPYRLLRLTDEQEFRFETVAHAALSVQNQMHDFMNSPFVSFSAGPVDYLGDVLFFVHWRDDDQNYLHYAVLFDRLTLRPKRISRASLFCGGDAGGLHRNVLYLMSVLPEPNGLLFFFGEGDLHVSFARMTFAGLAAALSDSVELDALPLSLSDYAGEYDYEHESLFRRRVFLSADGTILNGGAHDSDWRLDTAAGKPVLVLSGSGGVSCRLRQVGDRCWVGVWNFGARPDASLTKLDFD